MRRVCSREHCYELLYKSLQSRPRTPTPPGPVEDQANAADSLVGQGQPPSAGGGNKEDAPTTIPSSVSPVVERPVPGPDTTLAKMIPMADEELACGVEDFMRLFWEEGSSFYE